MPFPLPAAADGTADRPLVRKAGQNLLLSTKNRNFAFVLKQDYIIHMTRRLPHGTTHLRDANDVVLSSAQTHVES
jgi:hypothetical protein